MICFPFLFYSEPVTTYDMTYIAVFNLRYIVMTFCLLVCVSVKFDSEKVS